MREALMGPLLGSCLIKCPVSLATMLQDPIAPTKGMNALNDIQGGGGPYMLVAAEAHPLGDEHGWADATLVPMMVGDADHLRPCSKPQSFPAHCQSYHWPYPPHEGAHGRW